MVSNRGAIRMIRQSLFFEIASDFINLRKKKASAAIQKDINMT